MAFSVSNLLRPSISFLAGGNAPRLLLRTAEGGQRYLQLVPAFSARAGIVASSSAELSFKMGAGRPGYLVEVGNRSSFDTPQKNYSQTFRGGEALLIEVDSGQSDLPTGCTFYFLVFDEEGKRLQQFRVGFSRGRVSFEAALHPAARKGCFALRLMGTGRLLEMQVTVSPAGLRKGLLPRAADTPALRGTFPQTYRTENAFDDYLPGIETNMAMFERVAQRERTLRSRELFARSISGGTFSYEETIALARTTHGFSAAGTASQALNFDEKTLRGLLMLARVVFSQQLRPEDSAEALEIYEAVASISTKVFRQIDWIPFVLLSVQLRDANTAVSVLAESSFNEQDAVEPALLLCNILRKQALESGQVPDPRYFLVPLNNHLKAIGLEPVGIKPGAPSGFLSLDTGVLNSFVANGPKISVLMTTYNPDETLDIAVQSVLGQSWRNLELIIIDDCSSDDLFAKVKQYEQRDSRVRVLRTAANGGTYAAKNLGLSQAAGEFVTCHDSDDWSHPRKLELQMEALTASASLSVLSHWIRCTADLEFKAFSSKGFLCYENLSSLLFRRQPVLDLVGYFDNVRNGADSEFKKRLDRASGQTTLVTEKVPVSFGLLHGRSLTNNSLGLGWFSPERREYRMAASHWHYKLDKAAKGYRLERNPAVRPFSVRQSLLPDRGQHSDEKPHYDVIITSDFRMVGGNTLSSIEELKAQSRAGLKTAICQVDTFRKGIFGRENYPRAVHELLNTGAVDHVDLTSDVTATLMNIRYPAVFQFSQGLTTNIKADTIQIIANQPPAEADSRDRRYDVGECIANIREIFGTDPKWLPIGPSVRDALGDVPRELMSPTDWFNIIDVDEWVSPRNKFVGNRPVIGRHGRDDKSKWPETAKALYGAYPDDARYDVRVLGGTQAVQAAGFSIPSNWHVLPFNSIEPVEFLRTIDFFVYFHHSHRIEAFGRTVIEAMASGAVAILPESFRPLIGEGAIYCTPEEVRSVVDRYYADYALYRAQSQKGERFVRDNFGYEMHLGRLAKLGVQVTKA